jgi:hypothetical protein
MKTESQKKGADEPKTVLKVTLPSENLISAQKTLFWQTIDYLSYLIKFI